MKAIKIEGFDRVEPTAGFALATFGPDGSGKTRLIAQAQMEAYMEDAETGVIVLDSKTRDTLKQECGKLGVPMPLTNKRDYVSPQNAIRMALNDDPKEVMKFYAEVMARITDDLMKLADHSGIMTISIDPFTELYDYIFFEHYGRKNQIPALSRTVPNSEAIDLLKATRHKNLILTHRQGEIWADKGKRSSSGEVQKEPTGKFKLQGYNDIGYQVSAVIQMKADPRKQSPEKFSVDVMKAQLAVELEGEKDWLTGEEITWTRIKEGLWRAE